ncbi:MAG: D-alanine--D-alanine ligase [Crocinitomicaceae bacterium]|nr:D-alanine--D-alanine ligase [Crocinitomicaceae bacterium]
MKNVGIICGGFSSEYDISVKSACTIRDNFPDEFNAYLVYLSRDGWKVEVNDETFVLNPVDFKAEVNGDTLKIDVAIVYVHGDPGENGKVQAYLDMQQIPFINSGPLASELSFDKWFCNQFLKGFGIHVADSIYLRSAKDEVNDEQIVEQLGLPVFVKPCDSGSSYGIARVDEKEGLKGAIKSAFAEGETVILESFLDGTEVTCGVYKTKDGIQALPLTEIVTENAFFDFEAKYQGLSDEITPARISEELTLQVQEISKEIYQLMQLRSIARIDYMIVKGIPFVIEVNTTPGFSAESIVPKMINASGQTIKQFWTDIVEAELEA